MKKFVLSMMFIPLLWVMKAQENFQEVNFENSYSVQVKKHSGRSEEKNSTVKNTFIGKTIFYNSILRKEREVLVYDPTSDLIMMMELPYPYTYPEPFNYSLISHQSRDGGKNWNSEVLISNDTLQLAFPQAYIYNANSSQLLDSVIIGAVGNTYQVDSSELFFYSAMNGGCNVGYDYEDIPMSCVSEHNYFGTEVTDNGFVYTLSLCDDYSKGAYNQFYFNVYRGTKDVDHIEFGGGSVAVIDILESSSPLPYDFSMAWSQDGSIGYIFGLGTLNENLGETSISPIVWKSIDFGLSWEPIVEGMNMVDFEGLSDVLLESEDGHYIPLFLGEIAGVVDVNGDLQIFSACNSAKSLAENNLPMEGDGRPRILNVTVNANEGITGFHYVSTYLSDDVEDYYYADTYNWTHRLQSSRSYDGKNYFVIYGDTENADSLYQGQNAQPDLYVWGRSLDEEFSTYSPSIVKCTDGSPAFFHYSSDRSKSLGGPLIEIPTVTIVSLLEMLSNYLTDPVTISYVDNMIYDLSGGEVLLPPIKLSARQIDGTTDDVNLEWEVFDDDALGYEIYRNGELIETIMDPNIFSYTDENTGFGMFTYCMKAVYSEGVSDCSKEANIQVEYIAGICSEGLYTSGCSAGDGVISWGLADVNSFAIDCDGIPLAWYHNCQEIIHTLKSDSTYILKVQAGYENTYLKVWIDYNDNYQLEDSEIVVDNFFLEEDSVDYEIVINIPVDVNQGSHILRYRTNWNAPVEEPCAVYQYGNMADFTAMISYKKLFPPQNLSVSKLDNDVIKLAWDSPMDTVLNNSIENNPDTSFGLSWGGTFFAASRFELDSTYIGASINSLSIFPLGNGAASFVLKVWEGNNGELVEIYSQEIDAYVPNEWNTFALYYPVTIHPNKTLWIGYEVTHEETNMPSGVDVGPAVEGGDMFSMDGISFTTLSEEFDMDCNWNIFAKISFTGSYNIYYKHESFNDFVFLSTVTERTYNQTFMDGDGIYYYHLTSSLAGKESEPANAQILIDKIKESSSTIKSIYPIPASDKVYISSEVKIIGVSIYNLLGKKVKEVEGNDKFLKIDVYGLTGVFFLKIQTVKGEFTSKIIVD